MKIQKFKKLNTDKQIHMFRRQARLVKRRLIDLENMALLLKDSIADDNYKGFLEDVGNNTIDNAIDDVCQQIERITMEYIDKYESKTQNQSE